jgi:hypothetical protein
VLRCLLPDLKLFVNTFSPFFHSRCAEELYITRQYMDILLIKAMPIDCRVGRG